MTDLDRVLARLDADPGFARDLRTDPQAALAGYDLSDAEFARVEQTVAASSPPATGAGIGALFTPTETARRSWWRYPWPVAAVGVVALGALAGLGLSSSRSGGPAPAAASATDPAELTTVAYSSCPAAGAATSHLGDFHRGDRVWVVARDESGGWLQVRSPAGDRVWVTAGAVAAVDQEHLAVVACDAVGPDQASGPDETTVAAGADVASGPGTTVLAATPTPAGGSPSTSTPTGAPPSPAPTDPRATTPTTTTGSPPTTTSAPPVTGPGDHAGPTIQKPGGVPPDLWEHVTGAGGRCTTQTTSTVTATITDPSGVATTQLDWVVAGPSGRHGTVEMTRTGTTWSAAVGPVEWVPGAVPSTGADITVTIRTQDGAGNRSAAATTLHLHSAEECIG